MASIIVKIVKAHSPVYVMLCVAWQVEIDHVT